MENKNKENVFLFIPNIIGYGRIVLALISLIFMPFNHYIASACYILSGFLDVFDGIAARKFNESTKFGAMLDQLTDRCATMCLLVTLSTFYPKCVLFFQLSMAIDISCHWIHMHVSTMKGATSHKGIEANTNPIMKLYYTNRQVLFLMCAGNELFYSMLYLLYFTEGPAVFFGIGLFKVMCCICFPVAVLKSVIALVQGYSAWISLGELDTKERSEKNIHSLFHNEIKVN